jgi:hypothetical protein
MKTYKDKYSSIWIQTFKDKRYSLGQNLCNLNERKSNKKHSLVSFKEPKLSLSHLLHKILLKM